MQCVSKCKDFTENVNCFMESVLFNKFSALVSSAHLLELNTGIVSAAPFFSTSLSSHGAIGRGFAYISHGGQFGRKLRGVRYPDRLERGGPCQLLKLRWKGTQGVHRKWLLSWFVRWAFLRFLFLAALVGPVQNICFLPRPLFQCLCPNRSASWAGSRAGSPDF